MQKKTVLIIEHTDKVPEDIFMDLTQDRICNGTYLEISTESSPYKKTWYDALLMDKTDEEYDQHLLKFYNECNMSETFEEYKQNDCKTDLWLRTLDPELLKVTTILLQVYW